MQAAQHPALRARVIVLHKGQIDTRFLITLNLESLFEKAAVIAEDFGFNNKHTWKLGFYDIHRAASDSSTRCKYCP